MIAHAGVHTFQSAKVVFFLQNSFYLLPFSEGVWGNRSLGTKERFPQKYMKGDAHDVIIACAHGGDHGSGVPPPLF